jgi:acyl-CoA thioesterase
VDAVTPVPGSHRSERADLHLSPEPTGAPGRFRYASHRTWASWNGLYGGALLGALIEAMERVCDKPLAAVSAQFLVNVKEGVTLELHAELLAAGSTVSQASGAALLGDVVAVRASGSFGAAGNEEVRIAASFPSVRAPADSPERSYMRPLPGGLNDTLDVRLAGSDKSRVYIWGRCPAAEGTPLTAGLLSCYADHPPYATGVMLGGEWYGITLDTTLRIVAPPERHDGAIWVLIEVVFDTIAPPFAHASVNLWSEQGDLLAIGAQSMRIRHGIATKK